MAEILSVAVSISGLITLADAIFCRTFKYIQDVKHGPKEISALSSELTSIYGVLKSLDYLFNQIGNDSSHAISSVNELHLGYITLDKARLVLDKYEASGRGAHTAYNIRNRLKWPFSASETKRLIDGIKRHKTVLSLALSADSISSLHQVRSTQLNIQGKLEGTTLEFQRR